MRKPLILLALLLATPYLHAANAPLQIERIDDERPRPKTAPVPATKPESPDELRSHVAAYIEAMLNGDRAAILDVQEYYGAIHLGSEAKITKLVKLADGKYRVDLDFSSEGRIDQGIDAKGKHWSRKHKVREEYQVSLVFTIQRNYLQWIRKLEAPFVRPGKEGRYLIRG
jgi:hypothetical protein